ncbi:MAG: Nif11-like leader peptide family natural product precursor [Acidobacteriota bacterium]
MANTQFEQFRTLVLRDAALQKELDSVNDRGEFVGRVVELGRVNSFEFNNEDVIEAMREARRSWVERWK